MGKRSNWENEAAKAREIENELRLVRKQMRSARFVAEKRERRERNIRYREMIHWKEERKRRDKRRFLKNRKEASKMDGMEIGKEEVCKTLNYG